MRGGYFMAKRENNDQPGKRNYRWFIILVAVIFLLPAGLFSPGITSRILAGKPPPAVFCNGMAPGFDVFPTYFEETPLFPLREIFEERGFTVAWDATARRAVLIAPGRTICLSPENPLFSVDGRVYRTTRPPVIVQGRTLVALDFLELAADWEELIWDEKENTLHLRGIPLATGDTKQAPPDEGENEDEIKGCDLNFIEVLLPSGEQVAVGENFDVIITAPFVRGIYAYAVRFSYNPEQIAVQGLKNPSFVPRQEFTRQKIDNLAGTAEYLQTSLGYLAEIPPRDPLLVIEAKALCAGTLSLPGDGLEVTLLDNTAASLPAGLEEKTLCIDSIPRVAADGLSP